jgi:hypothetical protein
MLHTRVNLHVALYVKTTDELGNRPNGNALSEIGDRWIGTYLQLVKKRIGLQRPCTRKTSGRCLGTPPDNDVIQCTVINTVPVPAPAPAPCLEVTGVDTTCVGS